MNVDCSCTACPVHEFGAPFDCGVERSGDEVTITVDVERFLATTGETDSNRIRLTFVIDSMSAAMRDLPGYIAKAQAAIDAGESL